MPTCTVLIVEDQVDTEGQGVKALLAQEGFEVVGIAATKEAAVDMARQHRPMVVVMDIMLPNEELGGIEAARRIREEVGSQIVYYTGIQTDDYLSDVAWKVRPFAYVQKPLLSQLALAVRQACLQAQRRAKVFICYSHKDVKMLDELMRYLVPLKVFGIDVWVDKRIKPSDPWKEEIVEALLAAEVAIVLVSQNLVTSAFITEVELPTILKDHERGDLTLLSVYIAHVPKMYLSILGLSGIQAINGPDDPLDTGKWPPERRDREAWGKISEIVKEKLGASTDDK